MTEPLVIQLFYSHPVVVAIRPARLENDLPPVTVNLPEEFPQSGGVFVCGAIRPEPIQTGDFTPHLDRELEARIGRWGRFRFTLSWQVRSTVTSAAHLVLRGFGLAGKPIGYPFPIVNPNRDRDAIYILQ